MSNLGPRKGMVHVYTGDGKGKTTAALGAALRAMGWGARVCMVQFIKGYPKIGEAMFAAQFTAQFALRQFASDTSRDIDEAKAAQRREAAQAALACAQEVVSSGSYDLVILDEINNALHLGLVDKTRVLDMMRDRPTNVEIILTGRNAPREIIDAADYVTEMRAVKHPFEQGLGARQGIDY